VVELMDYFAPAQEGQRVRAVPGEGLDVPVWILGSSLYGAQLAAMLGLPYAFASHFAPAELDHAIAIYRQRFQPSQQLAEPYVMAGLNVIAAPSDDEARYLFTSTQQSFANLRSGRPGKLPPPVEDIEPFLQGPLKSMLSQVLSAAVVGSPATVRGGLMAFMERTRVDEIIVTTQVYEHAARVRSYELLAGVRDELAKAA
jgi:luciferase family oxidoreductase group 1